MSIVDRMVKINFPNNVRKLRKRNGWDQKELAKRAGLVQSTISRVEKGRDVPLSTAVKLSRVLKISLDSLIRR